MPEVIDFQRALEKTSGKDKTLLLGNGFSIEHFSYRNLLEKSGFQDVSAVKKLFDSLKTFDFEYVMRSLEDAAIVAEAYSHEEQLRQYRDDAEEVREGLIRAIHETHPENKTAIERKIPNAICFLKNFHRVFTLNYDLLLYWVQLECPQEFRDGFGLAKEENGFRAPFKKEAYCEIFNLHGALHLFRNSENDVQKRIAEGETIISAITTTIKDKKKLPIYVAEGSSNQKMARINSVPYLRHCYEEWQDSSGNIFIYGHSAHTNDAHIYRAIFRPRSGVEHLYFCIHQETANINQINGELARYKAMFKSNFDWTFVNSTSAQVWGETQSTEEVRS